MWFNDFLRALAELVRAAAWPAVAVLIVVRHKARFDELLSRVRELWGGTKFDPPLPPPQFAEAPSDPLQAAQNIASPPPTGALAAAPGALPQEIAVLRTPVVVQTAEIILNAHEIAGIADPAVREQALVTIAAALSLLFRFEKIEAVIWVSQIDLLEYLNGSAPRGVTREVLRTRFFDAAVAVTKGDHYKGYSFEAYLHFLESFTLIVEVAEGVTITEFGREYLVWRMRDGRSKRGRPV